MKRLIFLQNTYSEKYQGKEFPRDEWWRGFKKGLAFRNLEKIFAINLRRDMVWNLTPIAGKDSSSILPPDFHYIEDAIIKHRPKYVVACGLKAISALDLVLDKNLLGITHPSYRFNTEDYFLQLRFLVNLNLEGKYKAFPVKGQKELKLTQL